MNFHLTACCLCLSHRILALESKSCRLITEMAMTRFPNAVTSENLRSQNMIAACRRDLTKQSCHNQMTYKYAGVHLRYG